MQISRYILMINILLEKKKTTAKELAEYFGVSHRTILRDIEVLIAKGIPINTSKGKGGGVSLPENFVIDEAIFSQKEQSDISSSLLENSAQNSPNVDLFLKKLAIIFNKKNTDWLDVDFSRWGSSYIEREKFDLLKNAILGKNLVSFDYISTYGKAIQKIIEPLKIMFKGQGWHVYGFCKEKNDYSLFKITRIKNPLISTKIFEREAPDEILDNSRDNKKELVNLVLKIDWKMAYRIYDEFEQEDISKNLDGSFIVSSIFPEDEWLFGYIMSFGNYAEVLKPLHVREIIKRKMSDCLRKYL